MRFCLAISLTVATGVGLSFAPAAAHAAPAPEKHPRRVRRPGIQRGFSNPTFAAALFQGSTRVGVLAGLDGVAVSGVPANKLTTCDAFINGEFFGVASVLITPQAH